MKHKHKTLHAFMLKRIWKYDKTLFFLTMLRIPLDVINSLLNIYITSIIVGIVVSNQPYKLLITLLSFSAFKLFISSVMHWSEKQLSNKNYDLKMNFVSDYAKEYMKIDYAYIESAEGKDLAQRAKTRCFILITGLSQWLKLICQTYHFYLVRHSDCCPMVELSIY